ncbi:GmrSD restriction endonuclease domain-containing protein [Brevibacillus laterosporus]|uniref:GmrSD restriction endonucleases N-terminal domain-containing protein n=1 Tax=Brevibacillus laterosporus TaxID=1465 RepID=A0AAP8QGR6_BRELA|nr:DUF262 domain-containing protein [Brevibacillus laterosporus]PPB10715.1 hypothetical protein C4A77_03550 [Brevibacillus laterosporus]
MSIKVDKTLKKTAYFDPTKETINKSVSQLCSEVLNNKLVMPIFQRDLAWTAQKKVDLYNFQLNGAAPVSPISINRVGESSLEMPHITLINRNPIENVTLGSLGLIDGQQRISTNFEAYTNAESIRSIVLDITRGKFVDLKDKEIRKNQIPVGILYNKYPDVYTNYLKDQPPLAEYSVSSLLSQVRTKFFNYFYTVNFAENLNGEEQITWFNVLNLAGSRVPDIQLKLTSLQIKGLDFYKEYAYKFQDKLEIYGLDLFVQKNTEVSIPLATLNPAFEIITGKPHKGNYSPIASDAKENQISDLEPEQLRVCFEWTMKGLDKSLDFINQNDLREPKRIDYVTYLTGYFVYRKDVQLTQNQIDSVIEWYNNADFRNKSNKERRKMFDKLLAI